MSSFVGFVIWKIWGPIPFVLNRAISQHVSTFIVSENVSPHGNLGSFICMCREIAAQESSPPFRCKCPSPLLRMHLSQLLVPR